MKILQLKNNEIDKIKWDLAIKNSVNPLVYAYSDYLDITAPDWQALVYEDYSAVMPIAVSRKFGINYIYQPYFTQQSGVFYKTKINEEEILEFISAIPKKIKLIETNFNYHNNAIEKHSLQKVNYVLNLDNAYEDLYKVYSSNTIRNIKKSKKNELILLNNSNIDEIIQFKIQNSASNVLPSVFDKLKSLIYNFHAKNECEFYSVYDKDELIATTVFIIRDNRAYYILAASNEKAKKKAASFLIINEFIRKHAGTKMILDFEGSNIPGIARFFASWGAKPVNYYYFRQNKLPLFLKLFKKK